MVAFEIGDRRGEEFAVNRSVLEGTVNVSECAPLLGRRVVGSGDVVCSVRMGIGW